MIYHCYDIVRVNKTDDFAVVLAVGDDYLVVRKLNQSTLTPQVTDTVKLHEVSPHRCMEDRS